MKKEYNLNIKTSWNELSIEDYQKIEALGDEIKRTDLISILSDMSIDEVMDLPLEVLNSVEAELEFISESIDTKKEIKDVRTDIYKWSLLTDVGKLKASQFMDLIELTNDNSMIIENIHMIIAVITNKEIKRKWWFGYQEVDYNDRDIMEDANYIKKNFPIKDALTMSSFFLAILETSQINIKGYSEKNEKIRKKN